MGDHSNHGPPTPDITSDETHPPTFKIPGNPTKEQKRQVLEVRNKNCGQMPFNDDYTVLSSTTFESDCKSILFYSLIFRFISVKYTDEVIAMRTYRKHHAKFFANMESIMKSHNGVINDITAAELENLQCEVDLNEGLKEMLPNFMTTLFKGQYGGFGAEVPRMNIVGEFVNGGVSLSLSLTFSMALYFSVGEM
jgi:hypothetical protein